MAEQAEAQEQFPGPEELRKAYRTLQKELKQLQEQYETLRQQHKATVAHQAARELGLSEKHAELFLRTYDGEEISVDAMRNFAEEYSLLPAKGEETPRSSSDVTVAGPEGRIAEPEVAPPPPSFGRAGSTMTGTAVPGAEQTRIPYTEFQKLLAERPAEAARLYAEGRVEPAPADSFGSLG